MTAAGLSVLLLTAGCAGGRSQYKEGAASEMNRNFDEAYDHYKKAVEANPNNLEYRLKFERARFAAGYEHFEKGRVALARGDAATAVVELERAKEIDPSHPMTLIELAKAREILDRRSRGLPDPPSSVNQMREATRTQNDPRSLLQPKITGPISLRMNQNARAAFETLCELAGFNCLFHRQFQPGAVIPFTVEGIDIYGALDLLSFQTQSFWMVNDPRTIIIAPDNPNVRREIEPMIMKTIYLTNIHRQNEVTEIVTALRTLLSLNQVVVSTPMNAIMLRDTAAKVALAEQIVSNFDRPKAEVIVEVTVLEVDRNDLRQLGILPPTGTSLTFQQNGQLPAGTQAQPSEMMINDRSAFSSNHFSVAIPQTLAQFLANSSHTKLLQNPTIRATDNQVASLRIGTREPVASGSFQNTAVAQQAVVQFQFVDVGVNLDITPRVMLNRDVSIQATIVVSALAGERIIGGVSQPRFSNRSITHEIRLMEGETNMLGGIMSESESLTESGIPWLKDLPGPFGYFFSQKRRQLDQTEIIIMLTPHIVRVPNVTAENMCGLITGVFAQPTFRGFEGDCGVPPRGVGIAVVPGAGGDKSSTVVVPGTAQRGNPPGTVIPPVTPNPADVTRTAPPTTNITFAPSTLTLSSDMPSNLNLNINGGPNLSGAELTFEYDPAAFSIVDAHEGGFLSVNTSTNVAVSVSVVQAIDTQKGIAKIRLERATGTASSPQGVLLTLAVKRGSKKGNSTIRLTEARLREGAAAAAGTAQTYQIFNKPTEAQVTVP